MWVERDWHCPVVVEARELEPTRTSRSCATPAPAPTRPRSSPASPSTMSTRTCGAGPSSRTPQGQRAYTFIVWDSPRPLPADPRHGRAACPSSIARWSKGDSWGGAYARVGLPDVAGGRVHGRKRPRLRPPTRTSRPQQGAFWSTFRVIRAVSEDECQGVLDGMNAYDSAILSGGPVHFTLGLGKNSDGGEPPAPSPASSSSTPASCARRCRCWRTRTRTSTRVLRRRSASSRASRGPTRRSSCSRPAHRKYRGWVLLQNDAGELRRHAQVNPDTVAT